MSDNRESEGNPPKQPQDASPAAIEEAELKETPGKDEALTGASDEVKYTTGLRLASVVLALSLAIFLATLDASIIVTAIPYITDQFNSLADVGWYASIYPMAICISQLPYGKLMARYPIPWLYTSAMVLLLNVPHGDGAVIYGLFIFSVRPQERKTQSFTSWSDFLATLDLGALVVLAGSVVSLLIALQWGGTQYAWGDGRIIALLVVFAVLALAFAAIEIWQNAKAMLPARVFTQLTVLCASFFTFTTAGAIFVLTTYFPIWLQSVKGKSPLGSGVATLPWVITSTIVSLAGGILVTKLGYADIFMIVGCVFGCVGAGIFTTFEVNTSDGKWIGYQIIYAIGSSFSSLTPMMVAQNALPLADIPIGTGMIMFFQILGGAVFVSVGQSLFTNNLSVGLQRLGIPGLDASTVASAGVANLTKGLSDDSKLEVLRVINDALMDSWLLDVVLSCIAMIGALGVEHRKMKTKDTA